MPATCRTSGRSATAPERIGSQLATTLTRPEVRQAALVRTLDGYAQQHEQLVATAEGLDPPGPLRAQHGHLIDSLQFRVSGLRGLADAFGTRTGNAARVGELIGAQYRRLTASDVTWDDLFSPPRRQSCAGRTSAGSTSRTPTSSPTPTSAPHGR